MVLTFDLVFCGGTRVCPRTPQYQPNNLSQNENDLFLNPTWRCRPTISRFLKIPVVHPETIFSLESDSVFYDPLKLTVLSLNEGYIH